jgi:YjbE family integral membrane protein
MEFGTSAFWVAFAQIIWIDILLSGDNAVVIAMACRSLPEKQRRWGMIIGAGVAVLLRIAFAGITTTLMTVPFLKLIGAVLLFWVAAKLIAPEEEASHDLSPADNLWRAVRTIAVADAVMSLDNVIAIAGAAKGSVFLIAFGLALSIPLIVAGSAIVMRLLDRYPILIWAGAALLGWIAGELIVSDPFVHQYVPKEWERVLEHACAAIGAGLAVAAGWMLRMRQEAAHARAEASREAEALRPKS